MRTVRRPIPDYGITASIEVAEPLLTGSGTADEVMDETRAPRSEGSAPNRNRSAAVDTCRSESVTGRSGFTLEARRRFERRRIFVRQAEGSTG